MLAAPASAHSQPRAGTRSRANTGPTAVVAAHARHRRHAASACRNATTPAASASRPAIRNAVLCLVNHQRAADHLPPLRSSAALTRSAQGWADAMVTSGTFSHGADFAARIADAGYHWATVGENIATGFSTARRVVAAWMADVGHCRNILNPGFRALGVGIDRRSTSAGADGSVMWTQDFGLGISQHPRSSNWRPADGCPYH